ncbi:MAG: hypothetical protein EXQ49_12155 [Acidobacteria bacterium]|nr:hypothetical protein [Acidobacteriota bacterium]
MSADPRPRHVGAPDDVPLGQSRRHRRRCQAVADRRPDGETHAQAGSGRRVGLRGTRPLPCERIPSEGHAGNFPAFDSLQPAEAGRAGPARVGAGAGAGVRGLVLITGATGSGKSTTLAALVAAINKTRSMHILTIEDPIEFIHEDIMAVISQREVGLDVESYARGLLSALRQDPDVILLGELRDPETIETALVAAETGHLVLSTLHTLDAPETVNRIVAVFEAHKQPQVRNQLARVLRATVSQRLLPRADGQGRALATEVLVTTPYVRDCIADIDKVSLIAGAIASGEHAYGMQNFDQSIFALVQSGVVSVEEAANWVTNVEEFRMRLRGITPGSRSFSR